MSSDACFAAFFVVRFLGALGDADPDLGLDFPSPLALLEAPGDEDFDLSREPARSEDLRCLLLDLERR